MLAEVKTGQTLIVVFSGSQLYELLTHKYLFLGSPTLWDVLSKLQVATGTVSSINYKDIQNQPEERNWDDRPFADGLIPPLPLCYDGSGIFDNVFHESRKEVPC